MVQGHFQVQNSEDTIRESDEPIGSVNTGVAVVIPIQKVAEVLDQPELVAQREALLEEAKRGSGFVFDAEHDSGPLPTSDERAPNDAIATGAADADWIDPAEAAHRRDEMLRRTLNTPPVHRKPRQR
jgi:hypothetical protein